MILAWGSPVISMGVVGLVRAQLLRFVRLPWKCVLPPHRDSADGALSAQGLLLWGFFKLLQESAVAPLTMLTFP